MDCIHSSGELRAALLVSLLLAILVGAHHATLPRFNENVITSQVEEAPSRKR